MSEQADYVDDICTHIDCDCNCMTAKEKRLSKQIKALQKDCATYWKMLQIAKSKLDVYHSMIVQYPHEPYSVGSSDTVPIPKTDSIKFILDQILSLKSALEEARKALRLICLNFERQNSSDVKFLGDDDHEAWGKSEEALKKIEDVLK